VTSKIAELTEKDATNRERARWTLLVVTHDTPRSCIWFVQGSRNAQIEFGKVWSPGRQEIGDKLVTRAALNMHKGKKQALLREPLQPSQALDPRSPFQRTRLLKSLEVGCSLFRSGSGACRGKKSRRGGADRGEGALEGGRKTSSKQAAIRDAMQGKVYRLTGRRKRRHGPKECAICPRVSTARWD